jgi:hypothetical protein
MLSFIPSTIKRFCSPLNSSNISKALGESIII